MVTIYARDGNGEPLAAIKVWKVVSVLFIILVSMIDAIILVFNRSFPLVR